MARRTLGFLVVAALTLLAGCASTFPNWQPDRCQRAEARRDTLNWNLICIQTP
jgi:hypothetical protein